MIAVQFAPDPAPSSESILFDVCLRCQFLWFDAGELHTFPHFTAPPPKKELAQEAREALALWEVKRIRETAQREAAASGEFPDEPWKVMAGFFGMPVEHDADLLRRRPVVTWTVALLILAVSCIVFALGREALVALAFIPADPWRYAGVTWLTSFFVPGGVMHLIGNLYFFLVFGDNVEDLIGRKRFLVVLFLSALFGDFLHWLAEPRGHLPSVGASGGISGIIALYALAFPHARLGMMVRYYWVHFSARTGFLLWVGLQFLGVYMQIKGSSGVSSLAHLGGCLVGVFYWIWHARSKA
jgi:membrane associated rhomboid family serine protease